MLVSGQDVAGVGRESTKLVGASHRRFDFKSACMCDPWAGLGRCRGHHFGGGLVIIHDKNEKIKVVRDRLKAAQSRQKSYADVRRKDLEFQVGDWVFLKLSPWKRLVCFGKRGKLSPRYIGPHEIIERVGSLAYRLALPPELSRIHNVFHVSMLHKYIIDHSHVLEEQPISLQKDLSYEEEPVQILDRKEQVLRSKSILLVKVLWRSHQVEEATWESEEQMRQQYPYLFE
ncbi:hypothetical protein ACLB2K_053363 [Fragaria x ananassa]